MGGRGLEIDAARAIKLRADGWKWGEIARFLSVEADRHPPFLTESVMRAAAKFKQEKTLEQRTEEPRPA